jgi:predicted GH43/DUF377 family glycosyl hydrolase
VETSGFLANVVFHHGFVERESGALDICYGAADELTCAASVKISDILKILKSCRI